MMLMFFFYDDDDYDEVFFDFSRHAWVWGLHTGQPASERCDNPEICYLRAPT